MKKLYLIFLLLAVFISISAVSAAENMSALDSVQEVDDTFELSHEAQNNMSVASDSDDSELLTEDGDSNILSSGNSSQETVQLPTNASTKDIKSTYGTQAKFSLKLFDQNGT